MTELALPAGSLQAALQAFKEGADAVYLGLQQFSARKGATNFSFEDLSRLAKLAKSEAKKIYVTVNTLVTDDELEELELLLRQISFLEIDGVIVQDLGIANIIRQRYSKSIPLHGSTQLAVHSIAGVRAMQKIGFSRVVLSRELTLTEIERIRKACPDIELKVFIHGALCYGFSGLCMASQAITGRSANRGECAQICRTWFTLAPGQKSDESDRTSTTHGYFFSMTDLDAGTTVQELQRMGIDSLKIEGRMKSPAYVGAATRYYRMLLDGETDSTKISKAHNDLLTLFSRTSSGGWLADYGRIQQEMRQKASLGTVSYPGHQGVPIGEIVSVHTVNEGKVAIVRLTQSIAVHDGILLLQKNDRMLQDPIRFSISHIWNSNQKRMYVAKAGEQVIIAIPPEAHPRTRDKIFRISGHDQKIAQIQEATLPLFRKPVDMTVILERTSITLKTIWDTEGLVQTTVSKEFQLDLQIAKLDQAVEENLVKIFSMSDESLVTLGTMRVENQTGLPLERIFLPLSRLKEIRREWYMILNAKVVQWFKIPFKQNLIPNRQVNCVKLPPRNSISPHQNRGIVWIEPERILNSIQSGIPISKVLAVVDNKVYLPLAPVLFDESTYFNALDRLISSIATIFEKKDLRIGLNNIGQLIWACQNPTIPCFADIYMYVPNHQAYSLFAEQLPNLCGSYGWLEQRIASTKNTEATWSCPPSDPGQDFKLPIFISRSCFRYDSLGLSCENCSRNGSWKIEQNGKGYTVDVHNCLTIVTETDNPSN
jgi:U32 family peptidase